MKKFLFKVFLFALIALVLDQFFRIVVNRLPNNQIDRRVEKLIQGTINTDILVLGSSRAAHNIIAEELQSKTQLKTFNLGFRGSNLDFHLFLLNTYLQKNQHPKKLIYVADIPYIFDEIALNFRNDIFLPFVKYPEYRKVLIQNKVLSEMANCIHLAQFNYHTASLKPKKSIENYNTSLGSNPLPVVSYKDLGDNFVLDKKHHNSSKLIQQFLAIQKRCIQNKIDFYLVIPPNNRPLDSLFVTKLDQYLLPTSYKYCYKSNYTTKNNDYFYDVSHLNKNGASRFTNEVANFLLQ